MKKLYIKPQVETVSINMCQIVCDSLKFNATGTNAAGVTSADARERGYREDVADEPAYGDLW
jgi:hypothetical protein